MTDPARRSSPAPRALTDVPDDTLPLGEGLLSLNCTESEGVDEPPHTELDQHPPDSPLQPY